MAGNSAEKLKNNKYYFNSFPRLGLQAKEKGELLSLNIYTRYKEQVPEYDPVVYDLMDFSSVEGPTTSIEIKEAEEEKEIVESSFVIDDLDAREHEEYHENGELKLEVKLSHGLKDGAFKEYYPDGALKIKGKYKNGLKDKTWKYYDKEGNLIKEIEYNEGEPVNQ
jgi:antitoxin component YwqK of YwqJK toxin-antitoxin module